MGSVGIAEGWADGTFRGMDTVKRQDMAAFLHRLATKELNVADSVYSRNPFSDVLPDTPHREDVLWLSGTGVSEGWLENDDTRTFRGFDGVIRQDMAAFLHRIKNYADTGSAI